MAEKLGQPFMPWQNTVADVGCELVHDGTLGLWLPAYSEVIVTVPRQSGKTILYTTWQLDRGLNWGRPQRVVYTAQTGKDARDKWFDELIPLIDASDLAKLVKFVNRGNGHEAIRLKTGSVIRLLTSATVTGHGRSIDMAVLDEIWHDVDERREQGLRPAMITRADSQLLTCSTAGTNGSTLYNRKVQIGRQAALANTGRGVAYFEWSAPDGWDPADQDSWWGFMPALGYTILPEKIEHERQTMDPGEFRRAYGNVPTVGADVVIPAAVWARVLDVEASPEAPMRWGLDVAPDRSSAAIVACGANDVFELVDHRPGTGWVVDRCNALVAARGGVVAIDSGGPANGFIDSIAACEPISGRDVVSACGAMFDAIVEMRVKFRDDPRFDAAVSGAAKRPVGDNWVWSRKQSLSDITPLMAATLAYQAGSAAEPMVAFL